MNQSLSHSFKRPKLSDISDENQLEGFNFPPLQRRIKKHKQHIKHTINNQKLNPEDSITFDGVEMFKKVGNEPINEETLGYNTIGIQSQSSSDQEMSRILSMPSLRQRFEIMSKITSITTMLSYSRYRNLCSLLEEIDQMIEFLSKKSKKVYFTSLKKNLFEMKKINLDLRSIQQILTIWPTCYNLSWEVNKELFQIDQMDLIFGLDYQQDLQKMSRKQFFREKMFNYLLANGDYVIECELPARPDEKKIKNLDEYMNDKQTITNTVQEILKKIVENKNNNSVIINQQRITSQLNSKLLSIVKEKEEKLRYLETTEKFTKEILKQLCSHIHYYYQHRKVSNMFFVNVVEQIEKNSKKQSLDQKQIMDGILTISQIAPQWLTIIDSINGKILRMDKSQELCQVIKMISELKL